MLVKRSIPLRRNLGKDEQLKIEAEEESTMAQEQYKVYPNPHIAERVNTTVTEFAELHEHDTQDLYALLEDAQDSRTRIA
ncbi:hypothetical protein Tco_1353744 [Tanacetum coccineum]